MRNPVVPVVLVLLLSLAGCARQGKGKARQSHMPYVEVDLAGVGRILVDKVPATLVVSGNPGAFRTLSVLFEDSAGNGKAGREMSNYYSYTMEHDWVLLKGGDSVRTSYFQPSGTGNDDRVFGGVLVYEWPYQGEPDSLVFLDSRGKWGRHLLFLDDKTTR